jgi:hypothetical protein
VSVPHALSTFKGEEEMDDKEQRKSEIEKQIQKILSQGVGERRQVIVRMASPAPAKESLINLASDALRQRNMALSARECLPPTFDHRPVTPMGRQSTSQRQTLFDEDKSFSTKLDSLDPLPRSALKADGLSFLKNLDTYDVVQKFILQRKKSQRQIIQKSVPGFWTSKAALIEVSTQDLEKMAMEADAQQIRDIYPNRILRSPKLVEAKMLPDAVLEVKASSWGVDKIGALSAWGAYESRGRGIKIGVLDTGVDVQHPDLKGKVSAWAEFDANGNQIVTSRPHDSDQHGTHCCGTIAGGNASGHWIGVAPQATLAVALVLNGGVGTDAQVLAGIDWLVEQDVDVISMSLGGLTLDPETPDTYTEAILTCLRAGIPVVTAIGNEGSQTTGSPGNDLFAFAVGATDYRDRPAGFSGGRTHIIRQSNFIPEDQLPLPYSKPDVSAPGVAITSSIPRKDWAAFNGTSMATPHVAGAIGLILSATVIKQEVPDAQRAFVIQDLLSGSAEELGESGQDHRYGFGRIDVLRAIGFAIERGYGLPRSKKGQRSPSITGRGAKGKKASARKQSRSRKRA